MLPGQVQREAVRWLAYYTAPRHEKAVARQFQCRSVDCFLPLVRQSRRWENGVRAKVEEPLFPGYVFARLEPNSISRCLVFPEWYRSWGRAAIPPILDDEEIDSLRAGLGRAQQQAASLSWWSARRPVSAAAPSPGKTGILVKELTSLRVVLTVEAIMKSFSVEVDADELEAVS